MKITKNMRYIIILGITIIGILLLNTNSVNAETYNNLTYEIYGDSITITGTTSKDVTEVIIPSEINGIKVTNIDNEAFHNCINLINVQIPDTVIDIQSGPTGAFSGCTKLESIIIPDSVLYLGDHTFEGCTNLKTIKLPDNIEMIFMRTFMNCTSLTEVNIPKMTRNIMSNAFDGCVSLRELEIPDRVTFISSNNYANLEGTFAFEHCSKDLELIVTEGLYAERYAKENGLKYKYNNNKAMYNQIIDTLPNTITINLTKNEDLDKKIEEILVAPEGYQFVRNGWSGSDGIKTNISAALKFKEDDENIYSQMLAQKSIKIEYTSDDVEKIEKLIPNNMKIDIEEVEYQQASKYAMDEIKRILDSEKIEYENSIDEQFFDDNETRIKLKDAKMGEYNIEISINGPFFYLGKDKLKNLSINIYAEKDGKRIWAYNKYRNIIVEYNNENEYNKADEEYVKSIELVSPIYYEVDLDFVKNGTWIDFFNIIGNYYTNKINDETIVVKALAGAGDGGFNFVTGESGTHIAIFKNGILYDVRLMGNERSIPVINVPNEISGNKVNEYVCEVLQDVLPDMRDNIEIVSVEKGINGVWRIEDKDVLDGYKINYKIKSNGNEFEDIACAIMRREEKNVVEQDEKTNIKLDTNLDVVPINAELVAEEIKGEETIKVVKNALKEEANKFIPYDISITSNGVAIQPNEKVKISIPIPKDYDKAKLGVYRVAEDGSKTEYNAKISGNYATIETDHFSTYVITENKKVTFKLGDVNQDGSINAKDATLILKYMAKKATLTDEQKALADTDKDGKIKASDAVRILKYVTKKINEI